MVRSSIKAVYAALFGNLGIAIAKLIVAIVTDSTAMFAETLHFVSDTFNQLLFLFGINTSTKAATERHPFGYGRAIIFVLRCGNDVIWNIWYSFVTTMF